MKKILLLLLFSLNALAQDYTVALPQRITNGLVNVTDVNVGYQILPTHEWSSSVRSKFNTQLFDKVRMFTEAFEYSPNFVKTELEVTYLGKDAKSYYLQFWLRSRVTNENLVYFIGETSSKVIALPIGIWDVRFIWGLNFVQEQVDIIISNMMNKMLNDKKFHTLPWRSTVIGYEDKLVYISVGYWGGLRRGNGLTIYDQETKKLKAVVRISRVTDDMSVAEILELYSDNIKSGDSVLLAY